MNKRENRTVVCLYLLVFMLSVSVSSSLFTSLFTSNYNFDNDTDLETNDMNTLYNGKSYPFELSDVYDDENYTKIYTDAYLQTEYNQNGTIFEDQVSVVNNTNYKSPSNTDVSMIDGTFDDTDNMKVNDDSNSNFTSTEDLDYQGTYSFEDDVVGGLPDPAEWDSYEGPSCDVGIIESLDGHEMVVRLMDWASAADSYAAITQTFDSTHTSGTIEFWFRKEGSTEYVYMRVLEGAAIPIQLHEQGGVLRYHDGAWQDIIGIVYNRWYHIRIDFECGAGLYMGLAADTMDIYVDEVIKISDGGFSIVADEVSGLSFLTRGWGTTSNYKMYIDAIGYYDWDPNYDIGDNLVEPIPAELNFTVDLNFDEVDTSKLLALDVFSHHYTNVSQTIIGNVYNYTSSSYTQMFSSDNIAEAENTFMNDTSPIDYLDGSGNLRLKFNGTSSASDFKLSIDYIMVRFYYKMDIIIYKSFSINGIWRYRFKLIGSLHYTDWTVFEVIDPIPNFYAISESDLTTRWILQNSTLSPIQNFTDDIDGSNWDLYGVSEETFVKSLAESTDYLLDNYTTASPTWRYITACMMEYGTQSGTIANAKIDDDNYFTLTAEFVFLADMWMYVVYTSSLGFNIALDGSAQNISYYLWSSNPNVRISVNYDKWKTGNPHLNADNQSHSGVNTVRFLAESVSSFTIRVYYFSVNSNDVNISKNYFGDGYTYMQTNKTELISLKSIDYTTHYNLSSGDYFEVDFQTSSDSKINLVLLKDGGVNKTLTLSQSGNTNFGRHTVKISVGEFVEFDQLKISSTFEVTDNIIIYDVKTYKYTIIGDYADFYVGSNRDREVYLTPDVYNLRILEEGDEKINENITIPATGVLDYVYTPIKRLECRLALFNTENYPLEFTDYHIKINRSLNGIYSDFWLLESIFFADEDTYVYINISDRFDTLISSFERLSSNYIDLELEVYSLQIKNLMEQRTTIDVNTTHVYPLLSGDSIYFMLSEAYYQIGYYDTNDVYKQFTIYLNSNQAYELNRSKICFLSYADQQGNHLFFENYKTYLNGSFLYENVFYREIGDNIGIEIKDRYGISIKNETYTVISGDNYIPITLTMYSLKVMNQQENFNWINITRDPDDYDSEMYWSEWIAPTEIIEFKLFAGSYVINLTNYENGGSSSYEYTLNGDDVILITSGNLLSQVIYNLANVNSTIGNQITAIYINITNQNSEINNTIINIEINLSNINSSLGNLLTNIDLGITNIANNISSLYVFTNNSFLNLDNQINNSFIYMENNIIAINQTVSTLVIGLDGKISIVNATINTMWTEMNSQFVVVQSTLDFSFTFLNQTIIQIGNNITTNQIALNNLIVQRANEIDNSLIQISTLVNLINSSVVNESLVIQSLVNLIGNNITENHIAINDLINLIGNNITENNVIMTDLIELVGNNITTNQFVIQTLIDYVSNNITDNHLELLTNVNFINNTIDQNQIELINRLLFINNSINDMAIDLTNQIILVNNTIYSAILDVSTFINFTSDNILGNITLTYQQNDFLTELYKETMFSSLLNWSDVAFNYSIMEDRIDVWEFINNFEDDAIIVHLRYQDLIDNLTVSAQNTIEQYLPNEDVEYRLWSIANEEYLDVWKPLLPENKTVIFGYFKLECRLDLFNIENEILDFTDYRVKVNYSLNGVYNEFNLTVPIFDVDKDTYIYISVYDEFGTLIDTFERLSSENVFLDVEVYQLQIKSFLEKETTIDINGSHAFSLLPGDSKYFMLSKTYYQIGYYDEENIYKNFVCYLDSNHVYELNSTYYDVYISIFDTSGTLNWNDVKFYINDTRSDFGFNRLSSIYVNLKVLDYFNSTLFNQNVLLTGLDEYSIYITLYSLKIKNEASLTANYTLGLGIVEETGNILPQEIIEYRLAPNNYVFNYTNNEDGSFHIINVNLNENQVYIINTTYYEVYIGVYDASGSLDWNSVNFYINGTRADFGFNTLSSDYANLVVLDYFNSTLFNSTIYLRYNSEYSIYITLYSLKIKNEASLTANYTLTLGTVMESGNILPQEIIEYLLASNTYCFNYTNNEDNSFHAINVNLNENKVYIINTTYYDVYFSIFNFDGLGLNKDLVRFYINGLRSDFGFNVLKQDVNNLKVLDFFNATIFDQNVNLGHCTEYNILVEVYTLIINNNYTRSIRIEIERDNSNIVVIQIIPAQSGLSYRFLPDIVYTITAYDLNGTSLEVKHVDLVSNNKIVSFGFYSTEVPYDPEPLVFDTMTLVAFIIIICVFGWIIVIAWAYMKKDIDIIPEDTKLRHRRKRKAYVDRRKGFYDHS